MFSSVSISTVSISPISVSFDASEAVEIPVTVRAVRVGYYGGEYRNVGDEFEITRASDYSPYWMAFVEQPPTIWTPELREYSLAIDTDVLRWPGRNETRITGSGLDRPDD